MRFKDFLSEVRNLRKLSEGWRGEVYRGVWKGKDIAIKVAKDKSVEEAIRKEARILELLLGMEEFPQILFKGEDFFAYRFIDGVPFAKAKLSPREKKEVIIKLLELAYRLDNMGISKDEFGRLDKNVLIGDGNKVYLIDFERGKIGGRATNVTQFLQFLVRERLLSLKEAVELGKEYTRSREEVFKKLLYKLK